MKPNFFSQKNSVKRAFSWQHVLIAKAQNYCIHSVNTCAILPLFFHVFPLRTEEITTFLKTSNIKFIVIVLFCKIGFPITNIIIFFPILQVWFKIRKYIYKFGMGQMLHCDHFLKYSKLVVVIMCYMARENTTLQPITDPITIFIALILMPR